MQEQGFIGKVNLSVQKIRDLTSSENLHRINILYAIEYPEKDLDHLTLPQFKPVGDDVECFVKNKSATIVLSATVEELDKSKEGAQNSTYTASIKCESIPSYTYVITDLVAVDEVGKLATFSTKVINTVVYYASIIIYGFMLL
jgi:hypothetical protein